MMRSLLLFTMALWLGCSDRKPPSPRTEPKTLRSQNSGLGTVNDIQRVRITSGFQVWRGGQELTVQNGLLIRLTGVESDNFLPRESSEPLFVLGDTVGATLAPPRLGTGDAVLLMAEPPPNTEVPLWMTPPGRFPEHVTGATMESDRDRALSASGALGLNIQTPPANAPQASYPSLEELVVATLPAPTSPQLCAQAGKNCGIARTHFGMFDCGTCPAGQQCMASNQCCTPETDAQFCARQGVQCGSAIATDTCGVTRSVVECGPCDAAKLCLNKQCKAQTEDCNPDGPFPNCGAPADGCRYEPSGLVCVNRHWHCGTLVCDGTSGN